MTDRHAEALRALCSDERVISHLEKESGEEGWTPKLVFDLVSLELYDTGRREVEAGFRAVSVYKPSTPVLDRLGHLHVMENGAMFFGRFRPVEVRIPNVEGVRA